MGCLRLVVSCIVQCIVTGLVFAGGPYFATGIKIGEVTDTQAIIWTRLTQDHLRVPDSAPLPVVTYLNPETNEWTSKVKNRPDRPPRVEFPDNSSVGQIAGAGAGVISCKREQPVAANSLETGAAGQGFCPSVCAGKPATRYRL